MKKHFVITFLLMIFILIVHCTKEKKTNLKNNIYTYIHIYMYTHTHTYIYKYLKQVKQESRLTTSKDDHKM